MGLILERVKYNKQRLIVKQVFHEKGFNIWKMFKLDNHLKQGQKVVHKNVS